MRSISDALITREWVLSHRAVAACAEAFKGFSRFKFKLECILHENVIEPYSNTQSLYKNKLQQLNCLLRYLIKTAAS